jgi:hypothetical protein
MSNILKTWIVTVLLCLCGATIEIQAQVMKAADLEKYAKSKYGDKALVMTHAYSNAIMDKVEEAVKNGLVGNEDDDW